MVLERVPQHVTWVFTTTALGQQALFDDIDAHPLMSRCVKFELSIEDCATEIIERVRQIADAEGLGGASAKEFSRLAKECRFNMRDMLTHVEAGEMIRSSSDRVRTVPVFSEYDMDAIEQLMAGTI